MSAAQIQAWIGVVGGLAAALLAILKYFNYRTRRDRVTVVGQAFNTTVEALGSEAETRKLAAAILLRRFFDSATEQGAAGRPYEREAIAVIAALLRNSESSELQKLLADGLAYAQTLRGSDLQRCNLADAYLGHRDREVVASGAARMLGPTGRFRLRPAKQPGSVGGPIDLSGADLYGADLTRASLRNAIARNAVFYDAHLVKTVLEDADLTGADFRGSTLTGARFRGATLEGARFADATDIPTDVRELLDANSVFHARDHHGAP